VPDGRGGGRLLTAPSIERLDERAFRTVQDGGPTILSERMDSVRSVALGFWVRQGRVHEAPDLAGVSHLLEHMMFKGTEGRTARELAWEIERVGGTLDAYTTHEATAFQARVPVEHLELAVDILADLVFSPLLRATDLELEREVVLEEIAALEESPEEVAFELQAELLYGGHPYGQPIAGTAETVASMSLGSLRRVHETAYRPAHMVIAAAGAVEHERLLELLARHLPEMRGPARADDGPVPAGSTGSRRVERPGGRQSHLIAGSLTVPYRDPLRYAVVAASTALGAGMSSRLFQRIREDMGLAYSVYSFHCFFATAGHVGAYVGTRPETADRAREILLEELETLAGEGLRDDELADTRSQLKGQILLSLESPASRMNRLAGTALYDQPYRTVDEVARLIDAVDAEATSAATALFHPDRAAILELAPV